MIPTFPVSERRAAAARANGAKSRGPVTPQGKANSSRNSLRHGLRSEALFADLKSDPNWPVTLALYTSELDPRTEIEQALVETLALSAWRRTKIQQLEKTILETAMAPAEDIHVALYHAFRALADHSCVLELLNRFESRYNRDYFRALNQFRDLRTLGKNTNMNERTQEAIENKQPPDANEAAISLL
jgi:hypothetical protein